jgi:TAG lipase / steryl ester hydrolase / phospholipase A2 / LPA acyltransferase
VSIAVSGRSLSNGGPQRLLLNHIASPHVTLASAVAASCALPGIMDAQPLEAKGPTGQVVSGGERHDGD